jgi:Purple acid Phosphatase, N-terminal domain
MTIVGVVLLLAGVMPGGARAAGDTVTELHYSFGNTSDSVVFDWNGQEQTIYYGLTPAYGQTAVAGNSPVTPIDSPGPFRQVALTGLQPSTTYHYRIGTDGLDHTFQTLPEGDFTWADLGDTAATSCDPWIAQNQNLIAAQNPTFVTHGGDITYANDCGVAAVHQYYVDQQVWSDGAAFQPAWGNHEYGLPGSNPATGQPAPAGTPRDTLENYKGRSFITNGQTAPSDKPNQLQSPGCGWATGSATNTCQGNDWGWFQTGHVLFISYPEPWSNAYPAWQTKADSLMADAQANPNIDFIVTYGHRPAYSSVATEIDSNLQTAITNLAIKYSPSTGNPNGKYVLNVNHHVHWEEAFKPIHGLENITNGGGGAGQVSPTTLDPNSTFHVTHPGILSAQYSASQHRLTVNLLCGAVFAPNPKTSCTYGSTLYAQTFTRPNSPPTSAQLNTTLTDNDSTPQVGQSITYTVGVSDQISGTSAQGVNTAVTLPSNEAIVNPNGGTIMGNTVSWNLGTIIGGQPASTRQVVAQIQSGSVGSLLTATAATTASDASCQTSGSVCSATDTETIVGSSTQWITNQSVEANLNGWTGTYGGSPYVAVTRDTTIANAGAASIRVSGLAGANNLSSGFNDKPRWVTNTVAGLVYTQSAWIKPSFVGQKISMRLREWNGSTLVTDVVVSLTAISTNWQQLTQTLTAAGNGNQLSFAVYANNLSAGQYFNADDLSLTTPNS